MRRSRLVFAVVVMAGTLMVLGPAAAIGPGGWDHVGVGPDGSPSLNGRVSALITADNELFVGGTFTNAGGVATADRIASWDGSSWNAIGNVPLVPDTRSEGEVAAIAYYAGRIYVGGTFHDAGGNDDADFLAMWDGDSWEAPCTSHAAGPAFGGNVTALQVIGDTLYVGGTFQNGAGLATADYLVACDLASGATSSTVDVDGDFSGPVYALTADSNGVLYAGGGFINLHDIEAADKVAAYDGAWHAMGSGPAPAYGAVDGFVRSLAASGTDVYVGTDAVDVAGISNADHVVLWNGSAWSALGSNTAGTDGWFTTSTYIDALTTDDSLVFAAGSFQNADGQATADNIAYFDGTTWRPIGSDGAGNGPLNAYVSALKVRDGQLYAGGNFTNAGGDTQADAIASYDLRGPAPETTITSGPAAGSTVHNGEAIFEFASSIPGSTFECSTRSLGYGQTPHNCASPYTVGTLRAHEWSWQFTVTATSPLGATGSATRGFYIEEASPTIDSGPAEGSVTNDSTPSFGFSSTSAASVFTCSVDGLAYAACASPLTTPALADGAHSVRVRITNEYFPPQVGRTFTVDTVKPVTKLSGSKTQPAGSTVRVTVSCGPEACDAYASGRVIGPGLRPAGLKLRPATQHVDAGDKVRLKLHVPKKTQRAIRKALQHTPTLTAKLRVRVADEAGNVRIKHRRVTLTR